MAITAAEIRVAKTEFVPKWMAVDVMVFSVRYGVQEEYGKFF